MLQVLQESLQQQHNTVNTAGAASGEAMFCDYTVSQHIHSYAVHACTKFLFLSPVEAFLHYINIKCSIGPHSQVSDQCAVAQIQMIA